jgi:hypothetical protein
MLSMYAKRCEANLISYGRRPTSEYVLISKVQIKVATFWDVTLCSLVEVDWRFRGVYCLRLV